MQLLHIIYLCLNSCMTRVSLRCIMLLPSFTLMNLEFQSDIITSKTCIITFMSHYSPTNKLRKHIWRILSDCFSDFSSSTNLLTILVLINLWANYRTLRCNAQGSWSIDKPTDVEFSFTDISLFRNQIFNITSPYPKSSSI